MNRIIILILSVCFVLTANAGQNKAIVRIYCGWEDKNESHVGTGVFVSPKGHIITAAHVISGKGIAVKHGGREYLAKVVKKNNQTDVALLYVVTECKKDGTPNNAFKRNFPWLPLVANSQSFVGRNFTVNAFAKNDSPCSYSGILLNQAELNKKRIRTKGRFQNILYGKTGFSNELMQGMSGAPCIVNGQIVGIHLSSFVMNTNEEGKFSLTFIQPAEIIKKEFRL